MPEAITWNEGQIWMWTGSATASALIAFAENMQLLPVRGWLNEPALNGQYYDRISGRRADLVVGAMYTRDAAIQKLDAAETAVHMKLLHSGVYGSAGVLLWSGRIDSLGLIGSQGSPYQYQMSYHCNAWSAF